MIKNEQKVKQAVVRLKRLLPLQQKLQEVSSENKDAYQSILKSYIELGRSLNREELAQLVSDIDTTIDTLQKNDMVIFDDKQQPVGAYPFTMEERDHVIKVKGKTLHAMCALDALAISPMFDVETEITSQCAVTGKPVNIQQRDHEIANADDNRQLYFAINWNAAENNCCATSLCTEMIFLHDETTAKKWLDNDTENREIFSLPQAIEFASDFFKPLLD